MCLGLGDVQRYDQIISVNGFWLSVELQLNRRNGKRWVKNVSAGRGERITTSGDSREAAQKKKK